jgi:hypothetical protein
VAPSETPSATPTGAGGVPPVETATPTATPTATVAPVSVRFSEVLSYPQSINWDGRGRANAQDEWIELYNPTSRPVDVSRWSIEVPGRRLTEVYRFGRGSVIQAKGSLLLFQRESRLILDDQGGTLRLRDATGKLMDSVRYPALLPDTSYSRDAAGLWHTDWPPSPGEANVASAPNQRQSILLKEEPPGSLTQEDHGSCSEPNLKQDS